MYQPTPRQARGGVRSNQSLRLFRRSCPRNRAAPCGKASFFVSAILAADMLHTEDELPGVEHAPQQANDRRAPDSEKGHWLFRDNTDGGRDRDDDETETGDELSNGDVAGEAEAGRAQPRSGRGNEEDRADHEEHE